MNTQSGNAGAHFIFIAATLWRTVCFAFAGALALAMVGATEGALGGILIGLINARAPVIGGVFYGVIYGGAFGGALGLVVGAVSFLVVGFLAAISPSKSDIFLIALSDALRGTLRGAAMGAFAGSINGSLLFVIAQRLPRSLAQPKVIVWSILGMGFGFAVGTFYYAIRGALGEVKKQRAQEAVPRSTPE